MKVSVSRENKPRGEMLMNRLVLEAYARLKSCKGGAEELLDRFLCNSVGFPAGSLEEDYEEFAQEANENSNSPEGFSNYIYAKYMSYKF